MRQFDSPFEEQLEAENVYLREDISMERNSDEIIGKSDGLRYILYRVKQVAGTDATVIVLGETETEKGEVAQTERPTLVLRLYSTPRLEI